MEVAGTLASISFLPEVVPQVWLNKSYILDFYVGMYYYVKYLYVHTIRRNTYMYKEKRQLESHY